MRHRTLASAMLAAFGAIGGYAAPLAARPLPNDATVTSLRVVPKAGHADVLIHVDGSITLKHFTLTKPDKIVVDMSGATLGLPLGEVYDGVARGSITRIRYSQFTRTVVRVVLTLDTNHPYTVTQEGGLVRISVDGANVSFDPWQVGEAAETDAAPSNPQPAHVEVAPVERREAPAPRASRKVGTTVIPVNTAHGGRALPEEPEFQQSQEPRITVSWENAPIADVLGMFANFTGRTILPSKNVTGNVTANIVNLPWDVALKEVMNANGYDVSVNPDGVIVVDTFQSIAARRATTPLITRTVRLNYARSTSVAEMVMARLTRTCTSQPGIPSLPAGTQPPGTASGTEQPEPATVQDVNCPHRGTVTADTVTNSISITDVPSALPGLEEYVKTIDLRQPQVNIKAKIILVDRTSIEGLGLRYDLGSQTQFFNDIVPRLDSTGNPRTDAGQIALGGNTVSAIANATQRVPGAALQLVYSTAMGNFDFTTFLEALQQNTLLDVQAEPSETVMNNYTANLTAGTQVPIRVIDAGAAGGQQTSSFPRATVRFQQTGIILIVTPQITANHQVMMKVHVENSSVQFESNDVGAVFPKQSVDNVVLVRDGETAVMGGLTQQTLNSTRSGLPILSELPIIGRLFGVTNRTEEKRDLLILLTPHIIDDGEDLPTPSRP